MATGIRGLYRFVVTGAPGSGKGTISSWMVRDFGLKHLAAGDLLRSQIQEKTPEGMEASQYISEGTLVPNGLVTRLVFKELDKVKDDNWLLDGYPRNLDQATALSDYVQLTQVLEIHVPHAEIINRIRGRLIHPPSGRVYNTEFKPPKVPGKDDVTGEDLVQRDDDKPHVVEARLENYQNSTEPILEYYRSRGILKQFCGNRSDIIYSDVKEFLKQYFS